MNKKKVIIGSVVLISAAAAAYALVKKSQSAAGSSSTSAPPTSGGTLPTTVTTPAAGSSRQSKYPAGTLLRIGNEPEVFVIDEQGYRHWVMSRGGLSRLGLNIDNTNSISRSEMEAIPRLQNIAGLGIVL